MTALAVAYTQFGFVIAADGRQTSQASPGSECAENEVSDANQEIFEARAPGAVIAYAITGFVAKGTSYDLVAYANGQAAKLSSSQFRDAEEYVVAFGNNLKRYVAANKRDGVIELRANELPDSEDKFLIASIHAIGYFHGNSFGFVTQYHHEDHDVSVRTFQSRLVDGYRFGSGSSVIPDLARNNDRRFAHYRDRLTVDLKNGSMELACDWARAYIELCSEPLAAEIDPICKMIGGHIHVATVTPVDGFRWVVEPPAETLPANRR